MKNILALGFLAVFISILCWGAVIAYPQPIPKVSLGLLVDLTTQTPSNTIMVGTSFGALDLQFGFSKTKVAFFPCIAANYYFAGILVQQTLPASEAESLQLALPVGVQFTGPYGFFRIGYAYPLTADLDQGFFVEFLLQVDITQVLQIASPSPPEQVPLTSG